MSGVTGGRTTHPCTPSPPPPTPPSSEARVCGGGERPPATETSSPGFSSRSRHPVSSPISTWPPIQTPPAETQWPQGGFCVLVPWPPPFPAPSNRQAPLSGRQSPSQGSPVSVAAAAAALRPPSPARLLEAASPRNLSSVHAVRAQGPALARSLDPPAPLSFNDWFAGAQVSAEPEILFFILFFKKKTFQGNGRRAL